MIANEQTELVWAILAGLVFVGLVLLVIMGRIKNVRFKAGPVSANLDLSDMRDSIKEIHTAVAQINEAVNHKKPEEPTLVERVRWMEQDQRWKKAVLRHQSMCLEALAKHVGLNLPECPECHEEDQEVLVQ